MAERLDSDAPMRLNRYLARAGVESRRKAEELILAGRVSVNGFITTDLSTKVVPGADSVLLDDAPVTVRSETVTFLLNKPAGIYTTMSDPQGRACVANLVPTDRYPGLFPIGRLDRDTTGLLLFSTDGELGNALMHPSHHINKTYVAQIEGKPSATQLRRLSKGVDIKVGRRVVRTAPAEVRVLSAQDLGFDFDLRQSCLQRGRKGTSFVELQIHQGMKHQVKLMLRAVGHRVVNLHRVQFGPLRIGDQPLGEIRELAKEERAALYKEAASPQNYESN